MSGETILWIVFGILILVMLILDLGVFHRRAHAVKIKEALIWSSVWISLALLRYWLDSYLLDSSFGKTPRPWKLQVCKTKRMHRPISCY